MCEYESSKTQAAPDTTAELDRAVGAQARRPYQIGDHEPSQRLIRCTGELNCAARIC